MQRLRRETEDAHREVEGGIPLMHAGLKRGEYVACLQRMHGVVAAWEDGAQRAAPVWMQDMLTARRRRELLESDLAAFGVAVEDGGRALLPELRSVASLLGAMYVMEGSTLGGQLIARHVEKELALEDGRGNAYFRGHGEQTGRMWKEFCGVIQEHVADDETDAVVMSARAMFQTFGQWMHEGRSADVD